MSLDRIAGTWEGFYTYGPEYFVEYLSVKEEFIMELREKSEVISGTCVDRGA